MAMQFIYVDSSPPTSSKPNAIRKQELQQSLARRHAALHSHRARKSGILQKRHSKDDRQQLAAATQSPPTVQQWPLSPPPSPMSIDAILTPSTDASPTDDDTVSNDHAPARSLDLSLASTSRLVMHRDHHGTRADPFNSIPVETTSPIWNHVDYYLHCMSPAQSIVDDIFNVNSVYTTHWLRLLLLNESLATCGMAGIESAMHSKRHPGEKLPRSTLELIGKALNLHRRHMQERNGKADGPAIVAALILATTANSDGDHQSFLAHKNSLKPLITSAGGFEAMDQGNLIKNTALHWESFWAMSAGIPTVFPDAYPTYVPHYPSYPFNDELAHAVSKLPPGFQLLAQHRKLASDVIDVLIRAVDIEHLNVSRIKSRQHDASSFIARRYSGFWEACPCLQRVDDADGRPDLEKLIVLSLMLYCFHALSPERIATTMYRATRARLTADVSRRLPCSEHEQYVLLWVWMNAVDACRRPDGQLLPSGIDVMANLRVSFPDLEWQNLRRHLKQFFWNNAFEERCAMYWDANLPP